MHVSSWHDTSLNTETISALALTSVLSSYDWKYLEIKCYIKYVVNGEMAKCVSRRLTVLFSCYSWDNYTGRIMVDWAYSMVGGSRYGIFMEKCFEKQHHPIWKVNIKIDFGGSFWLCGELVNTSVWLTHYTVPVQQNRVMQMWRTTWSKMLGWRDMVLISGSQATAPRKLAMRTLQSRVHCLV
jgi:hypothetical protein